MIPQDAYGARFRVYDTADPTFAVIGANRPWIRSDVAEPDNLRWYLSDGTLSKKSTGLTSTAVHEADALTKLTHPQVMARGVFSGPF